MRHLWLGFLFLVASPLAAVDDFDVIKLQQDVHNLEARVQELTRQVSDLREQLTRASMRPGGAGKAASGAEASSAWLDVANWARVQPGMSEMDVIGILGLPSSMRNSEGGRLLLYATEIGSSGFLGGSVTLRDGKVTEVALPVLK